MQSRVAEAWGRGRALILNAHKPGYSEAFTISCEQYRELRAGILRELSGSQEVLLKHVTATIQEALGGSPLFPKGRMTNYVRYVKTDLEARGEVVRVEGSSPQRIRGP
ncbi:MAG: hypothetical protein AAFZ18_06375 [Myxococcota bacterium]